VGGATTWCRCAALPSYFLSAFFAPGKGKGKKKGGVLGRCCVWVSSPFFHGEERGGGIHPSIRARIPEALLDRANGKGGKKKERYRLPRSKIGGVIHDLQLREKRREKAPRDGLFSAVGCAWFLTVQRARKKKERGGDCDTAIS